MSRDEKYERYLEARAESLGLPTDPEAYQDGGLAEIAAATTVSGADTLVALVRPGDLVLVKGSRGIRTDIVVDRLKAEFA